MNDERARVLRMVAEGKITAEEAADLLDALTPPQPDNRMPPPPTFSPALPVPPTSPQLVQGIAPARVVHIEIVEDGQTKVNLRLPIALARAAGRFIPRQAQSHLEPYNIKLDELLQDLGSVTVRGPLIEINDDEDRVVIAVE